jgi:hypothetical protein
MNINIDLGDLEYDSLDLLKINNRIEVRVAKGVKTYTLGSWEIRPWENERDVKIEETEAGAINIQARKELPWLLMGPNTQRLWRAVKADLLDDYPGADDEELLFKAFSRYLNEYTCDPEGEMRLKYKEEKHENIRRHGSRRHK